MNQQKIADAQRRWLLAALSDWQAESLVSSDQAAAILARYETDEELGRRSQSIFVFALMGMAGLLFGLAMLLLIGFNWEALPRSVRLVLIFGIVIGTHTAAFYLRDRTKAPRISEVLFFLGCLLYGTGIWLIAQVFHVDAHYPDGIWWWAVGVLPFALLLDSLLCHLLFIVLVALWAGIEVLGYSHLSPWFIIDLRHLPNGAYSLPILALPGLFLGYRKASRILVGVYVALLTWWVVLQAFAWGLEARSVFWMGSIGAILLILAEAHRRGNAMAIPYRLWGALLVAGVLIPLSLTSFWRYEIGRRGSSDYSERWVMASAALEAVAIVLLFGIVVVLVILLKKRADRGNESGSSVRELLRNQWFPVTMSVGMAVMAIWSFAISDSIATYILPTILANFAMLGLSIYLIRVGAREERVPPFASGIVYFLIWTFARYVDLFSHAGGMLGAAALFALCGAGLIVVARFWSKARAVRRESGVFTATPEPFIGPAWIDRRVRWASIRARPILLTAAVLQILLLVGMIAIQAAPLVVGETIVLHVTPIDPRDLFRGDYVILNYDINRVGTQGINGAPFIPLNESRDAMRGHSVYVTLEPDADGKHWHAVSASILRPTRGKYIRGRYTDDYQQPIQFGIETYFVQEGKGLEWEKLRNSRKLSAEIALSSWGHARLRRLIADD